MSDTGLKGGPWRYFCIILVLFSIYTLPLGDILCSRDAGFHLYADDTQLYLACDCPNSPGAQRETISCLEACITDIRQWMPLNGLKLNDRKSEFWAFHSKHNTPTSTPTILIGQDDIPASSMARNLGVIFDTSFTLCLQISSIVKAPFLAMSDHMHTSVSRPLCHKDIGPIIDIFMSGLFATALLLGYQTLT